MYVELYMALLWKDFTHMTYNRITRIYEWNDCFTWVMILSMSNIVNARCVDLTWPMILEYNIWGVCMIMILCERLWTLCEWSVYDDNVVVVSLEGQSHTHTPCMNMTMMWLRCWLYYWILIFPLSNVLILDVWVELICSPWRAYYESLYMLTRIMYELMIHLESEDHTTIV